MPGPETDGSCVLTPDWVFTKDLNTVPIATLLE